MEPNAILVIAAHPDDEILGCGGVMAKYAARGVAVTVVILTDGGLQRYDEAQTKRLRDGAHAAGQVLGYGDIRFLDLPDQRLDAMPLVELVQLLEGVLDDVRPDTVYTHHEGDVNFDHRVALRATMAAVRPMRRPFVRRVYSYSVLSSTEQGPLDLGCVFTPTVFEDISEYLDAKCQALACYESEVHAFPHPRSSQAVRAAANMAGLHVGVAAAEPFVLRRELRG